MLLERCAPLSDRILVEGARAGHRHNLETLWTRYRARVAAVVRAYITGPEDREDLAQEIMLRAFESLDELRDPAQFAAWLDVLARRRCIDFLRRRSRVRFCSMDALPQDDEAADPLEYESPDPGIEDAVVAQTMTQAAHAALSRLSPKCRAAFALRTRSRASVRDIAQQLGVTEGAVKSLVYRARRSIEGELAPFLAA